MSTVDTTSQSALQTLIERRLDAVDQALLGILPRPDRQAVVSQIELRIRELVSATSAAADPQTQPPSLATPIIGTESYSILSPWPDSGATFGGWSPAGKMKLSKLALWAGVVGILAVVLMLCVPVTFGISTFLSEIVGETVAILLLGAHGVALVLGGVAAVGLGIAALVKLNRRKQPLAGYGWAISGLCTGSLPMLLGIGVVLILGIQLGAGGFLTESTPPVVGDVNSPPDLAPPEMMLRPAPISAQTVGYESPTAIPSERPESAPRDGAPATGDCPNNSPSQSDSARRAVPTPLVTFSIGCCFGKPELATEAASTPLPETQPVPESEFSSEPSATPESPPAILR